MSEAASGIPVPLAAACVVLIPVRHRPHRVRPVLDTLDVRALFIASPGDNEEHDSIRAAGGELLVAPFAPTDGDYARKINLGFQATTEPLLFLGADDLCFHHGWFAAATARLEPGVGVVGTNDLTNPRVMRGDHATHSLVTRGYVEQFGTIDEPGKVLHEGYAHEFVDDEFVETARSRGAFVFAEDSLVEHLHPMAGKAPMDALYAQQRVRMRRGARVFQRRRHLWTSPSS